MQNLNSKIQKTIKQTSCAVHFINPKEIVDNLEIKPGMQVADFGCGTGFFTFPIANKIGEEGVIYALDILPEKIEVIQSQAKLAKFSNIITKRVNLESKNGSGLNDASMDWVIIVNMLYQNKKKENIMLEAKRILKKNGKILLIDWENLDNSIGPNLKIRISKDEIMKMLIKSGFGIFKEIKVSPPDIIESTAMVLKSLFEGKNYPSGEDGRNTILTLVAAYKSNENKNSSVKINDLQSHYEIKYPWA